MKRDVSSFFCNSMNKYFVLLTFDIILSNLCLMMNIRVTESVSQNYCPSLYNYNHFNSKIPLWFFFQKASINVDKIFKRPIHVSSKYHTQIIISQQLYWNTIKEWLWQCDMKRVISCVTCHRWGQSVVCK